MRVVGLTGGIGSGKSTVAGVLARLGAKVVDADAVVHRLLADDRECRRQIVKGFGPAVLTDGRIDRRKLAAIVFDAPVQRRRLERLLHPLVAQALSKEILSYERTKNVEVVVLEIPLLFEAGFDRLVDIIVVVGAKRRQQIERAAQALGVSQNDVLKRIKAQMPLREKTLLADVVIDNSRGLEDTERQAQDLWRQWTARRQLKMTAKVKKV